MWQVLYNELKLDEKLQAGQKIARTNINNEKSTSETVLSLLEDLHPLPKVILEYRQVHNFDMIRCTRRPHLIA